MPERAWSLDLGKGYHPLARGALRAVGLLRRLRSDVRAKWSGEAEPSNKHVVYVHFDERGQVHDYVLFQLRCFADLGYAVTFVTNSPRLGDCEIKLLLPLCRQVILRRNVGYDFGAYREGLNSIPYRQQAEQIILTNDSQYGPLFPLEAYLSRCTPGIADIWGMTDSHQIAYHLQSYFILLYPAAIMSPALRAFWRWYPNVSGKKWAILEGELKLTAAAISAGLKVKSLFSSSELAKLDPEISRNNRIYRDEDVVAYREYLDRHSTEPPC